MHVPAALAVLERKRSCRERECSREGEMGRTFTQIERVVPREVCREACYKMCERCVRLVGYDCMPQAAGVLYPRF